VTVVIGGIVDHHVDAAQRFLDLRHHGLNRTQVGQVTGKESRAQTRRNRFTGFLGDVAKGYLRALGTKASTKPSPMPLAPPLMKTRLPARLG
jgi:hypothetical protein